MGYGIGERVQHRSVPQQHVLAPLSYVMALVSYILYRSTPSLMNFYFEAVTVLDKLDAKKGSIKGVLASVPEKNRKRTAALVIETLKCKNIYRFNIDALSESYSPPVHLHTDKQVLSEVIDAAQLLKQEKKLSSRNLALVLVHDLLLARGIQAGDGPLKQAVLRHRTRLSSEFQRLKIKHGAKSNEELAQTDDSRACKRAIVNIRQPLIGAAQHRYLDISESTKPVGR